MLLLNRTTCESAPANYPSWVAPREVEAMRSRASIDFALSKLLGRRCNMRKGDVQFDPHVYRLSHGHSTRPTAGSVDDARDEWLTLPNGLVA